MKKIVFIFICIFSNYLSATPNLQTSNLTGILVRCAKKNLSYVKAIQLLQDGTIRRIRTENPNAQLFTYINETNSTTLTSEEITHATIAKTHSPGFPFTGDSSLAASIEGQMTNNLENLCQETNLPNFLKKNLTQGKDRGLSKITIYVPITQVAKLTAFLFPMHNKEFKANNFTSCFLGTPYGPAIIKYIVNILTSDEPTDTAVTNAEIVSQSIKIITDRSSSKLKGKIIKEISEDILEFLITLRESIEESTDKNLPINILMSYLWGKSSTYTEAIRGLNIYPDTPEVAHTERDRVSEPIFITELKNSDPSKVFPTLMEKVVLNTGKPHADCAEVTVRNFLNLVILNPNGSVKNEFLEFVSNSPLLSGLYSLSEYRSNLKNDIEKAHEWNSVLIPAGVECTSLNPSTEMKAGFENFIRALNFLLDLHPAAELNLCSQFQAICQKLSISQTIKWRRKVDIGGQWRATDSIISDISNYDEIIFGSEKDGRISKNFTINQHSGHAFIE